MRASWWSPGIRARSSPTRSTSAPRTSCQRCCRQSRDAAWPAPGDRRQAPGQHRLLQPAYNRRMTEVASRELRNDTAGLIKRAAAGEDIVITVNGKPAARLTALAGPTGRRKWLPREELIEMLLASQADPGLR